MKTSDQLVFLQIHFTLVRVDRLIAKFVEVTESSFSCSGARIEVLNEYCDKDLKHACLGDVPNLERARIKVGGYDETACEAGVKFG